MIAVLVLACLPLISAMENVVVFSNVEDTILGGGQLQRENSQGIDASWTLNLADGFVAFPGILALQKELTNTLVLVALPGPIDDVRAIREIEQGFGASVTALRAPLPSNFGSLSFADKWVACGEATAQQVATWNSQNPGNCFVFFGNNAHGDIYAASKIIANGGCIKAIFIRDALAAPGRSGVAALDLDEMEALLGIPVENVAVLYDTPAHAAALAYRMNLITLDGLQRVLDSITNSPQWASCDQPCQCEQGPLCFAGICQCPLDGCQADPVSLLPPGCEDMRSDVDSAQEFVHAKNGIAEMTEDACEVSGAFLCPGVAGTDKVVNTCVTSCDQCEEGSQLDGDEEICTRKPAVRPKITKTKKVKIRFNNYAQDPEADTRQCN